MDQSKPKPLTNLLTVIALSMLAYTLAVGLHEHLGHTLACLLLGGHPAELGAFYVNCTYGSMPDLGIRLVALAGPLVSLLTGAVALALFDRDRSGSAARRYLLWLYATISLMIAAGYLLFSGVSGIGDFGTVADGVFFGAQPEWAFRVGLTLAGVAAYVGVVVLSVRRMDRLIGGAGGERVRRAQWLALSSYLTGVVLSVLVGLLNPHGLVIVLTSSAASSLGGTSGLAWSMQMLNRKKDTGQAPFVLKRSWPWIVTGLAVAAVYAALLGPTIRP